MANKRLIDANALLEKLKKTSRYFTVKFDIEEAPTVDAVEVVHARWRVSRESEISKSVWCTACGEEFYLHKKNNAVQIDKMPYCPNCGAKMDGGAP